MNKENVLPFQTIRQVASNGPLSEHYLRLRLKQGKLPGFYVGTRYLVDCAALMEMLHREALLSCGVES